MRLIDADITIKDILKNAAHQARIGKPENARGLKYAAELMEKQLTAYDVEKVVEKLEHDAQMLYSLNAFEPVKAWRNDLLIPVVKGGLDE
jgi:hypothetical protein